MKIASITTHALSMPLPVPLWTAHETVRSASAIVVEVKTDDGLVGFGEIHGEPMKHICDWVKRFAEIVRGMDALGHTLVWETLFSLTNPRPGGAQGSGGLPPPLPRAARPQIMAAIAGIDIALWDIKGKAAGLPVYRVLGGSNQPVFAYATGGYYRDGATAKDYAEEVAAFVKAGYRAVKIKCCAGCMADEVARIKTVRAAVGADTLLMLDMNAAYSVDECIRFARAVEPHNIYWLEEPLHWYLQPFDFLRLAAATTIPLAHCERELTRFSVRDFVTSGAIRFVQFDSTRFGGFTEALRVAHLAEQCDVRIAPHLAPELHTHLAAAYPKACFGVETLGNTMRDPLTPGIYKQHPELTDGHVLPGEAPGFGLEIDWEFVRRHVVQT
jgi:D-galactarolactone cycloisomerase